MNEARATELCYLPALELRERYRRRELSPVEVAEAVLARIERLNPRLNAYVTVTAERALADARAAEAAYAPGGEPGPPSPPGSARWPRAATAPARSASRPPSAASSA